MNGAKYYIHRIKFDQYNNFFSILNKNEQPEILEHFSFSQRRSDRKWLGFQLNKMWIARIQR